jgi:hypothetical protein
VAGSPSSDSEASTGAGDRPSGGVPAEGQDRVRGIRLERRLSGGQQVERERWR